MITSPTSSQIRTVFLQTPVCSGLQPKVPKVLCVHPSLISDLENKSKTITVSINISSLQSILLFQPSCSDWLGYYGWHCAWHLLPNLPFAFLDSISYSPSWTQAPYVSEDDLKLLILSPPTHMLALQICATTLRLGIKPWALCMPSSAVLVELHTQPRLSILSSLS